LINISKIINDKYYTSSDLAEYCVNKTEEIIGKDNITEYLEPSAGNGVFLDYLQKTYKAYDIDPEDNRIVKQDYLQLDIPYKQGRCIIGNPPYGNRNVLSVQFYKKSIQLGDYISFILPISQLNNNQQMYEFDMIYSEDLGIKQYSGRDVHCCFNIYKRPKNGLNQKPKYKLNDVNIIEVRQGNKVVNDYDLRICNFGSVGKESKYPNQYTHEFCIKVNNTKYKNQIIDLIKKTNWKDIYGMTASPALYQWQVYKYIKEQIPDIN
jgi:hypothetical protein